MIDEPSHPRVRAARRCHSASGRAATGRFLAEGPQAAREAVATPGAVVEVFVTPAWVEHNAHRPNPLDLDGRTVHRVSDRVIEAVSETATPQGIVAVCRDITVGADAVLERRPRLVVVLVEVRDPGNAGTIIRSADAAGADAVVLTTASVDPLGGKCVRATAGSLFHLPIVVGQPPDVLDRLRDVGLTVLAADSSAALDLFSTDAGRLLERRTAWLVGNEAHGLPARYRAAADAAVRVPVYGRAESLNASVAAAVCLYASAAAHHRSASREAEPSPSPD